MLTSYLDAAVPIFFGTFLLVMVRLPNAKYHTDQAGVATDNIGEVVGSVFIFAAVELLSFGLLAIAVYRTLRLNVLYHPAFVLETQAELVQSKLLTWVILTMAYRVVHFGTLRFGASSSALSHPLYICFVCLGMNFTFKFD